MATRRWDFGAGPCPSPTRPVRACRAALAIRAEFEAAASQSQDPLADFRMGIGIATGRAVAGKIGTIDQVKVTVFGPVVNLASRLEGMTKILQAPILLDERTAAAVRCVGAPGRRPRAPRGRGQTLWAGQTAGSFRAVAAGQRFPILSDDNVADYERALDELLAGRWPQAFERLHRVPAEDRVKDFLTVFIAQHNRTPPENWNGVIPLTSK